jgi:hypothetical protein
LGVVQVASHTVENTAVFSRLAFILDLLAVYARIILSARGQGHQQQSGARQRFDQEVFHFS